MPVDRRIGTKVDKRLRREDALGTRVDPYPYIGIVKNNLDPSRSGRLQVYIPDLGGDPTDKKNWRTVRYASPFGGWTSGVENAKENKFETVQHHYGMWMVPPDLEVHVLCLFVAGDPQRGFWIACVNPYLSHHMVPAIAGSDNAVDDKGTSSRADSTVERALVAEFNQTKEELLKPDFYRNPKPIHTIQQNILRSQGLDTDVTRGPITSSSQRETPSHVFGISTPGRRLDDPADNINQFKDKINELKLDNTYLSVKSRKGGHTFVMDDGTVLGEDQLIRLRSATGHQILMHDSSNCLYIAHSDGTSWIELTSQGSILMYTRGSFSVHSEGAMNFHSGGNMNFDAGGSMRWRAAKSAALNCDNYEVLCSNLKLQSKTGIDIKSGGVLAVDSAGKISMQSGERICMVGSEIRKNTGGTVQVKDLKPLQTASFSTPEFNSSTGLWRIGAKKVASIVTSLPTHEPYNRGDITPTAPQETGIQPQENYSGAVDAIQSVKPGVSKSATDTDIRNQPETTQTVGPLNKEQLQAYYAQIGKSESGGDYQAVNTIGFVGKYQFGYMALIDGGYVKSNVTSNAQLNNPNSWTGKDGIGSKDAWLNSPSVQESAMEAYTARNYRTLVRIGAVTKDMPADEVGGMLATSHLLGAGGAKKWRLGQGGSDAYGTTGDTYFQRGRFAIAALAPRVPALNAG